MKIKSYIRSFSILALAICISLACGLLGDTETPEPTQPPLQPADTPVSPSTGSGEKPCGDGVCDGPENAQNCPQDCGEYGIHTPAPFQGRCGDGTCEGPENATNCPQDCQEVAAGLPDRSDVVVEVDQSHFYEGTEDECWDMEALRTSTATSFAETVDPNVGSPDALLYFGIVVHIEPHEEYLNENRYQKDAERLRRVAEIVAAHGGRMTVQTQPPFLDMDETLGDPIHKELEALGNEIALHFHEDVYVGSGSDHLPVEDYVRAMSELRAQIKQVSGASVTNWAGGNTYIHMWEAASQAGYKTNCNYKNRYTQTSAPGFAVVNPWRPAGAANEEERLVHDPNGLIIYIPSGVYPIHCRKLEAVPRPYGYEAFDYVTYALKASLQSATPEMVNTFYITFHPGDFLEVGDDEEDFASWDAWLTQIIDPLVADGRLRWATIAEMAAAFEAWESKR
jgi:hypothetical protein